jgi:hypothetical protein
MSYHQPTWSSPRLTSRSERAPPPETWGIFHQDDFVARFEETKHYQIRTREGEEEFQRLLPSSGHRIEIVDGDQSTSKTYTVAMFHQLHCIGIIRREIQKERKAESQLAHDCLNYLRQVFLCSADSSVERVYMPRNMTALAVPAQDYLCHDPEVLYKQKDFMSRP